MVYSIKERIYKWYGIFIFIIWIRFYINKIYLNIFKRIILFFDLFGAFLL